ncbi:MAG: glutamate--tRNA ligase [Candidatus Kaiserbacteria bacterium]|nr:MAG: glutamate--tRNA ligase [Candidatus Kaiserbacteria bacterium]
MNVITRFPPSPTGFFHIGSARTALFNHLFTAHAGGTMYLRFEDTDQKRSKKEYEDDILAGLAWLRIPYELPKVFRQSERTSLYKDALQSLIEANKAYVSKEPAKDDPTKEVEVVRIKNPGSSITFTDLIRGDVTFDTAELGDFVIARTIDAALYHFTVVVDDAEMGVTHVIRGEDHISNTARQILILEALGYSRPQYAHIPLILAPDRSKLSKRHGAVSVNEYRAEGFLPEALVNYLALLGWNPGGEREIFALSEIATQFKLEDVQKAGAIFNVEKLLWFNHQYLAALSNDEYERRLAAFFAEQGREGPKNLAELIPLLHERAQTLKEATAIALEYDEIRREVDASAALLLNGAKTDAANVKKHLAAVRGLLENISNVSFDSENVKAAIFPYASEHGRASVLWPLRVALSGKEKSADPFTLAAFLGKETTLARVSSAIDTLSAV